MTWAQAANQTGLAKHKRKVAFFGSPAFALPVLEALLAHFELVLVVSQPSKPVGRGLQLTPPPVAAYAAALGIPLAQPKKLRGNASFAQQLKDSGAEVAVTCAYGKLLPPELLAVPAYGFLNTHTSLLPKYRGAAPIQWALIEGEQHTGTTIMQTEAGLDTGPILLQERLAIQPNWTSIELADALSAQAARLIVQAIARLDELQPQAQDHAAATHVPMLSKEDGFVRWADSAQQIVNRYRGVAAWPQTTAFLSGKRLKLGGLTAEERPAQAAQALVGQVLEVSERGLLVAAGVGAVRIKTLQPEARKPQGAQQWASSGGYGQGTQFDV